MPIAITTAITILDWVLTAIPAALAGAAHIRAIVDDLKAKHAAGEQFVSADIFTVVGEMKEIDADIQAEAQRRRDLNPDSD